MAVVNLNETSADRVAPEEFVKRLKQRDSALDVIWHPATKRWIIVREINVEKTSPAGIVYNAKERVHVWTVRWPNGRYRPLDEGVFEFLNSADSWDVDVEEYMRRLDEFEAKKRERSIRASGERMEHFVRSNRVSFNNWMKRVNRGLESDAWLRRLSGVKDLT